MLVPRELATTVDLLTTGPTNAHIRNKPLPPPPALAVPGWIERVRRPEDLEMEERIAQWTPRTTARTVERLAEMLRPEPPRSQSRRPPKVISTIWAWLTGVRRERNS